MWVRNLALFDPECCKVFFQNNLLATVFVQYHCPDLNDNIFRSDCKVNLLHTYNLWTLVIRQSVLITSEVTLELRSL